MTELLDRPTFYFKDDDPLFGEMDIVPFDSPETIPLQYRATRHETVNVLAKMALSKPFDDLTRQPLTDLYRLAYNAEPIDTGYNSLDTTLEIARQRTAEFRDLGAAALEHTDPEILYGGPYHWAELRRNAHDEAMFMTTEDGGWKDPTSGQVTTPSWIEPVSGEEPVHSASPAEYITAIKKPRKKGPTWRQKAKGWVERRLFKPYY